MSLPDDPPPPGYGPPPYGYGPPPPGHGPPPPGYGPPPYGAPAYGGGPGSRPPQETVWAVLCHLSVFVFPLLGPLAVYLVFRDTSPFNRHHAAQALNFHLTLMIATFVAGLLVLVLIGFVLLPALLVYGAVMGIVAAVAAGNRQPYRYPLTLPFVR